MKTFRLMLGTAIAAAGLALASTADAAPAGVKIGTLNCNVAGGMGFVFGSTKDLACSYEPTKAAVEHYAGTISKWGVDIGYTGKGKLIWAVFAPTSDVRPGAIEGEYAGASAQANVGVGLGANVLIGGLDKSIALQPVSVEGSTGLNAPAFSPGPFCASPKPSTRCRYGPFGAQIGPSLATVSCDTDLSRYRGPYLT
jgi:hypothetical protein